MVFIPHSAFSVQCDYAGGQSLNVLSGGARKHKESARFFAGQGLLGKGRYFSDVRIEKSGLGRRVAARRRCFRRSQQFAEAICILFFADIQPGQVAKIIKAKRRLSRSTLNCGKSNADLLPKLGTERAQLHLSTHGALEIIQRKLRTRVGIEDLFEAQLPIAISVNSTEDRSRCLWRPDEPGGFEQGGFIQFEQFRYFFDAFRAYTAEQPIAALRRSRGLKTSDAAIAEHKTNAAVTVRLCRPSRPRAPANIKDKGATLAELRPCARRSVSMSAS